MKLYGIAGKKQSGKNTFADFAAQTLFQYGMPAKNMALADPLKQFCVDYLYPKKESFFGNDFEKNKWLGLWRDFFSDDLAKKYGKNALDNISGREIMQVVGTDIFRAQFGQDFWTKLLKMRILQQQKNNIVIFVTDVRFPNEIEMIKSLGGKMIKIYREIKRENIIEHASENALDNIPDNVYNYIVDANQNRSMESLREAVAQFLYSEGLLEGGSLLYEC